MTRVTGEKWASLEMLASVAMSLSITDPPPHITNLLTATH